MIAIKPQKEQVLTFYRLSLATIPSKIKNIGVAHTIEKLANEYAMYETAAMKAISLSFLPSPVCKKRSTTRKIIYK